VTYFKLILTSLFWGGTFIAGKLVAEGVDPCAAAFLRFLAASFFLILLTLKMEGGLPRLALSQLVMVFLLGLTGIFAYNILFFYGLHYIRANQASLIIATNPIFITLCSAIFFREHLTALKITGLLLSVAGALIVISDGRVSTLMALGFGKGELLIFGCVFSWVAYSILGKKAMNDLSPVASVCYSSIAGTVLLFFPAVSQGMFSAIGSYSMTEWASLFYLGFFGTVLGFFWYYEGIQDIGPVKAGIFINLVPVSAIILSFFILKEPLGLSLVTGGICVIAGVYLTNMTNLQKEI